MRLLAALLFAVVAAGCRDASTPDPVKGPAPPAPAGAVGGQGALPAQRGPAVRSPLSRDELPTDDASVALGNLEGDLANARRLVARDPGNPATAALLVDALLAHGALHGRLAEYDEAEALAEKAMERAPSSSSALLARAAVRARFHRFEDALADLASAEKRGAGGRELELRRASCLQAQGRLAEARPIVERWASASPSFASLLTLATLDADEGRLDEAERNFHEAQQHLRDVSPFPVARLWLQEALMWMDAGRAARARELLEAAHERVPSDVAVIAHLAAAYAATREPERAVPLLRPLVTTSDDPEPVAQLAELLADSGDPSSLREAKALGERAAARFDELVKAHPEAFADHAARFLLRSGSDVARAASLADLNLTVRRTGSSYALAIDAHLAAGEATRACGLADRAVAAFSRFAHLRVTAAKAYTACGMTDKADAALDASLHPRPSTLPR